MAQREVVSIHCNSMGFTICIGHDGNVYSSGIHDKKAHGNEQQVVLGFTLVPSLVNIVSIACGRYHTVCLDNGGFVFTFGSNTYGQLGIGKINILFLLLMSHNNFLFL